MATIDKTPYDILGVSADITYGELRGVYRTKIHEHKQKKISPINFRRICRAYETLSDFDKRNHYDTQKEWTSDLPIDKYTLQQLAAEPDLIRDLKKRLEDVHLEQINAQDPVTGHTALYCAARAGNVEAVKLLTARGAESDLSQRTKSTALHVASFYGHADVVRCLLEGGADYRIVNSHDSTAEEEAYNDDVERVFAELKENAYVRVAADELDWFRENGLTQHVDTEYFAQRQTLLHCTCKKGYFDLMRWLVETQSANIDLVDFNGKSSLHLAVYGGHLNITEYLLNRGCNPKLRSRWGTTAEDEGIKHGRWISDLFKSMHERDMFEMAKQGVDWWFYYYFDDRSTNMVDSNGISLLYHACRHGQYSVAKWLLEHGANVNIQMITKPRSTPLHGAKYRGHVSIVELLLEYEADVNIKNDFGATVFDEEISNEVDTDSARKINELLQQYKSNLKSEKLLVTHVYEDDGVGQEPVARIKLEIKAEYNDLTAAVSDASGEKYPYFSIARRVLVFGKDDPTIISAVCCARYASSKFIDTPICLVGHKTKPKECKNQWSIRDDTKLNPREFTRLSHKDLFTLKAPLTEKKTIAIGNLRITFNEGCINKTVQFEVTTIPSSNFEKFGLYGCICLFKTELLSDASNLIKLPTVSVTNEPNARLYTLAQPTSCWFTSNPPKTHLPMIGGIHAFMCHIDIIPHLLTLPADMFLATALGQPLTVRDHPVRCTYLSLRKHDVDQFPHIAYHGTNINAIRSILLDGLVVPGTVVSNGTRINPPDNHIARNIPVYGVSDFAAGIFLSPSVHYSSDSVYAIDFTHGDRQSIPILECSVKRNSFTTNEYTVSDYDADHTDELDTIEWRVDDPTNIEINAILFITKIESIFAARMARMAVIAPFDE